MYIISIIISQVPVLKNLVEDIMSKYGNRRFLKETRARIPHTGDNCSKEIKKGEIYYPESIGRVNVPRIKLRKCYEEHGDKLLPLK